MASKNLTPSPPAREKMKESPKMQSFVNTDYPSNKKPDFMSFSIE